MELVSTEIREKEGGGLGGGISIRNAGNKILLTDKLINFEFFYSQALICLINNFTNKTNI